MLKSFLAILFCLFSFVVRVSYAAPGCSNTGSSSGSRTEDINQDKIEQLRDELSNLRRGWWYSVDFVVDRRRIFESSFYQLFDLSEERWRSTFYISFRGESGVGVSLTTEWFTSLIEEILSPNRGLFIVAPDGVSYTINPSSPVNRITLEKFEFAGRVVAKSVFDEYLLPFYFTRSMLKHILGKAVDCEDLKEEDPDHHRSLQYILQNRIDDLSHPIYFSVEVTRSGSAVELDLKPNGSQILVTDGNKEEYVQLACAMQLHGKLKKQLASFLKGFYQLIPSMLLTGFNEKELELAMSGEPTIDLEDIRRSINTDGLQEDATKERVLWFWEAVRSFNQSQLGMFLQFLTGTPKPPPRGFQQSGQRIMIYVRAGDHTLLPTVSACDRSMTLPEYQSYEETREKLLTAIEMGRTGFINGW